VRNKLIVLFGLILALITAFLIYSYLDGMKKSIQNIDYIGIVVAKESIPTNTVITQNMLEVKSIPTAYKHGKEITDLREAIGRVSLIPFSVGQSILDNQVIAIGDHREGLAYRIPKGKRAMSIAIDDVSGVSGLLKGGDRVDIITTITMEEAPSKTYTVVVLQDIEILAVGRSLDGGGVDPKSQELAKTITLAVSLEESLGLKTAALKGSISLMLRSPIDDSRSNPIPFKIDDFIQ